ncbi:MAG: helix-turn-helix domain-containing protein [Alphaproteobacteria bacterium]
MFNNNDYGNERTEWQSAATYTQEHVGYYLKKARERLEISLEQASEDIRVRRVYLEAIEEGRYDQLPGTAYAVGFVRNYAKYLGLDAPRVVEQFRAESTPQQTEMELEVPIAVENNSLPKKAIILAAVVLAILSIIFYMFVLKDSNEGGSSNLSNTTPAVVAPTAQPSAQDQARMEEDNVDNQVSFPAVDANSQPSDSADTTTTAVTNGGGLSDLPSNADGVDQDIQTIDELLGGGDGLDTGEDTTPATLQEIHGDIVINNYALPQGRGLEGWRSLNSMSIAPKPAALRGGTTSSNNNASSSNNDLYAPNAPVTAVAGDDVGVVATQSNQNTQETPIQPIGREPKIQLLATETSFIYVFREGGDDAEKELKIGRLAKGEKYVIPEGEESFLLTFVDGGITAILDGQTQIPLVPTGGKPQRYSYASLKEQAATNTQ